MANARLYPFWGNLTEALHTGRPQNEASNGSGESPFTALHADPAGLKNFLAAMSGISRGANIAIAKQVPWSNYKTFADIGTAQGDLAVQIALANPHLHGIGYQSRLPRRKVDEFLSELAAQTEHWITAEDAPQ